jgi:hypothetical protein
MEKDIGKIQKNDNTEVIVRIDDFGGKVGVTIREFVTGDRYTGFTKAGTRIASEKFLEFRELINSINIEDLKAAEAEVSGGQEELPSNGAEKSAEDTASSTEDY